MATPDRPCLAGIVHPTRQVCCNASCGLCGGHGCSSAPGGPRQCCMPAVLRQGRLCHSSGDVACIIPKTVLSSLIGSAKQLLAAFSPLVPAVAHHVHHTTVRRVQQPLHVPPSSHDDAIPQTAAERRSAAQSEGIDTNGFARQVAKVEEGMAAVEQGMAAVEQLLNADDAPVVATAICGQRGWRLGRLMLLSVAHWTRPMPWVHILTNDDLRSVAPLVPVARVRLHSLVGDEGMLHRFAPCAGARLQISRVLPLARRCVCAAQSAADPLPRHLHLCVGRRTRLPGCPRSSGSCTWTLT